MDPKTARRLALERVADVVMGWVGALMLLALALLLWDALS